MWQQNARCCSFVLLLNCWWWWWPFSMAVADYCIAHVAKRRHRVSKHIFLDNLKNHNNKTWQAKCMGKSTKIPSRLLQSFQGSSKNCKESSKAVRSSRGFLGLPRGFVRYLQCLLGSSRVLKVPLRSLKFSRVFKYPKKSSKVLWGPKWFLGLQEGHWVSSRAHEGP